MRKSLSALVLMVALCFSLCATASAASYVADDITYQNLNGQQLAIKIYTLLPDQNPDDQSWRKAPAFRHGDISHTLLPRKEILRGLH